MIQRDRVKRLFTFGCSFTRYGWTTWPMILSVDLNVPYWNYGSSGAGNQYMFNTLMQADSLYNFTEDDLVVICWTNVCREDRFVEGDWLIPGNVFTQNVYDDKWVKQFCDPTGMALRDYATIKASDNFLESKKCQYQFLSMLDITKVFDQYNYGWNESIQSDEQKRLAEITKLFNPSLSKIRPSFYDVLWDGKVENKMNQLWKDFNSQFSDAHPSPIEHYRYLEVALNYKFKESTTKTVQLAQDTWDKILLDWSNDPNRNPVYPHKELYANTYMGNAQKPDGWFRDA